MRNPSVLLIEDNPDDEWFAKWTLKRIGLTDVTSAHDGHEALLMLHGDDRTGTRESCSPDMILLDLKLPKIDGLEVLRRIRNDDRTRANTVLILTSSEDPHDRKICLDLGVTAYFTKPLREEDIVKLNLFPGPT